MSDLNQEQLSHALGALIAWLETWKNSEGAYNGFVIHRTEAKRMQYIHDTAWTQAAIIRGYANLYGNSGESRWHDALETAAELQYRRYDPDTGRYAFAGHEDDRFCSLVHCALANCALLDAGKLLGEEKEKKYVNAIRGNVDLYWMPELWVENEGAFRFNSIDFFSLNEDRFVINFNTMAAECLLKLARVTGDERYEAIALRVGKWLIEKCNHARNYYCQQLNSLGKQGNALIGGLPYQYTPTQKDPENCVSLYAGLALRGITELYTCTKNNEYARIAEETLNFLIAMRDPETNLFFQTTQKGKIERYPLFIAGVGMTLVGMDDAARAIGKHCDLSDTVRSILLTQYQNGGFPSFLGKNCHASRNGEGEVWEDVALSMNWNAQCFEYLSRLVVGPEQIEVTGCTATVRIVNKRFIYIDTPVMVAILSWWPLRSIGLYLYTKKREEAWLSIYPVSLYGRIRSWLRPG